MRALPAETWRAQACPPYDHCNSYTTTVSRFAARVIPV